MRKQSHRKDSAIEEYLDPERDDVSHEEHVLENLYEIPFLVEHNDHESHIIKELTKEWYFVPISIGPSIS